MPTPDGWTVATYACGAVVAAGLLELSDEHPKETGRPKKVAEIILTLLWPIVAVIVLMAMAVRTYREMSHD